MAYLIGRAVGRPLNAMTAAMRALARGELDTEVPSRGQTDEIGEMSQAVQVFKDAGIEKLRLEADATQARRKAEDERYRAEADRALAAQQQAQVVDGIAGALAKLASGDLVQRLDQPYAPEYESLRADFNAAVLQLQDTMRDVTESTGTIRSGTGEISTASDDLSRRTEQQAASLEETAAALAEITSSVKKTADGTAHARRVVGTARTEAAHSTDVIARTVRAMGSIEQSSRQISQIIGVIDEIAFQTNLLALNAGVEAARAGDAGRGFAVVASEVRGLAQRSAEAAKEIKTLILASSQEVEAGVNLVDETGKALGRIVSQVAEIDIIVNEIAGSTEEQAAALVEVNTAINQMDQVTQQNAAMVEEATAATHSLAQESEGLARLIGRFKVGGKPMASVSPTRTTTSASRPSPRTKVGRGSVVALRSRTAEAIDSWEEF
ncbi:methyl-accepting chemotaxis protein [Beijerinckia sp. L45]|uniref:methyl-accepting chemotaxis protein n=1 Tax=Beijerinckia sp. L45 TaxID=1641855 RepID=UPI0021100B34|nr:methyl-accepting chemotaxis protein [Beijerinckia sp. L45]